MVHCKILVPTATAVALEEFKVGVVMVATPDIKVHEPVPIAGALPANTVALGQIV